MRSMLIFALFIFGIVSLDAVTVSGKVTKGEAPVSGATVFLTPSPLNKIPAPGGYSVKTNESGEFIAENVKPGRYMLTVTHTSTGKKTILIKARSNFTIAINMADAVDRVNAIPARQLVPTPPSTDTWFNDEIIRLPGNMGAYTNPLVLSPSVYQSGTLDARMSSRGMAPSSTVFLYDGMALSSPFHYGGSAPYVDPYDSYEVLFHRGGHSVVRRDGLGGAVSETRLNRNARTGNHLFTEVNPQQIKASAAYQLTPGVYGSLTARQTTSSASSQDIHSANSFQLTKADTIELITIQGLDSIANAAEGYSYRKYAGANMLRYTHIASGLFSWSLEGQARYEETAYTDKQTGYDMITMTYNDETLFLDQRYALFSARPSVLVKPLSILSLEAGAEVEYYSPRSHLRINSKDRWEDNGDFYRPLENKHQRYTPDPFLISGGFGRALLKLDSFYWDGSARADHYGDSGTIYLSAANKAAYDITKHWNVFADAGLYQSKPDVLYLNRTGDEDASPMKTVKTAEAETGYEFKSTGKRFSQTLFALMQQDLMRYNPSSTSYYTQDGEYKSLGLETAYLVFWDTHQIRTALSIMEGTGDITWMENYIFSGSYIKRLGPASHSLTYKIRGLLVRERYEDEAGTTTDIGYRVTSQYAGGWSYYFDMGASLTARTADSSAPAPFYGYDPLMEQMRSSVLLDRSYSSVPFYFSVGLQWRSR